MRRVLISLAVAVAGLVLVVANPPAQAEQAMTADQQTSLTTAIAAGDVVTIANLAAHLSGPTLAALATQLVASSDAALIANVLIQVQFGHPYSIMPVAGAVGVAVAASPNAITLAPVIVVQTAQNRALAAAQVFAGAIISNSTNGEVVKATRLAADQAGVVPVTVLVDTNGGIVVSPPLPVPPPCTTSCT